MNEGLLATVEEAKVLVAAPVARDFEYKVRLNVAIPLAWAKVLKTVGANHYDYKCQEAAQRGVVNALYNVAVWNEEPVDKDGPRWPSTHPVEWADCDCMMKILELGTFYGFNPGALCSILVWLRLTMDRLSARGIQLLAMDRSLGCASGAADPLDPASTPIGNEDD